MALKASLLGQAGEQRHLILLHVAPSDLAAVLQTCRELCTFIKNDNLLWKRQYLKHFDCPSTMSETDSADETWAERLKAMVKVGKLMQSKHDELKKSDETLQAVAESACNLMTQAGNNPLKNINYLVEQFASESNISAFLCRSSLFENARFPSDTPASTEALRQLSAKLHVYFGLELEPPAADLCQTPPTCTSVHSYARSRIYDLRRYKNSNLWGPFLDDGSQRVDWEKVQAIMIDLAYNLRMYTERCEPSMRRPSQTSFRHRSNSTHAGHLWDIPFQGLAPNSYTSHQLANATPIQPSLEPDISTLDPYGVTGTWMRVVCFLDYNDLYAYNFESGWIPITSERPPIDTREAFRLIRLQLRVTSIEEPNADEEGSGTKMPIVHFEGRSKSTYMAWDPNANSRISGTARTTPDGAIRWTTFSIFHGEPRWRSEGIQVGGIRSARGILGNWFDKDYDRHGPAGPTAFWKVSDDVVEDKKQQWGFGAGLHAGAPIVLGGGAGGVAGLGADDDDSDGQDLQDLAGLLGGTVNVLFE